MPGAEAVFADREATVSGADLLAGVRDTDADWREVGQSQPYWGVLSHPDFRAEAITPERVEAFYSTGRPYIDNVARWLKDATGASPSGRALDFGCGVGRLSEAMCAYAADVTGLDVSPGMLELARARSSKVTYVGEMPDGPFDWINSFIVFQHIAPVQGLEILKDLLARLAPGGAVSLQFATWREARHEHPTFTGWRARSQARKYRQWLKSLPAGQILMYDYDLNPLVRLISLAGIEEMKLVSTDHDGHHGVIILGRKTAPVRTA
jgi:SAM-dependent methyltransferase